MHRLLLRQLRRHFPNGEPPAELRGFIDDVEGVYLQADADRELLERSLELTSQDLLERGARLEAQLLELQQREVELVRLADAIGAAPDEVAIVDPSQNLVYVNAALVSMHGFRDAGELLGRHWKALYDDTESQRFRSIIGPALATSGRWFGETRGLRADGSTFEQEVALTKIRGGVVRIVRDVSERKRLEAALRQSQKMEALGRLAGGIAHDINNVLTVILACADLVLEELPQDSSSRPEVEEIRGASQRASTITSRLLALARRQLVATKTIVLDDAIEELGRLLRRTLGEHVELVTETRGGGATVRADAGQIEQILLNLVLNARDAMPDGGRITLRTAVIQGPLATSAPRQPVGPAILVTVADTGPGIDDGILAHLFEPFFTTKDLGSGTGLGLATCYGIVHQLEGAIWADSKPGSGTTFSFFLPICSPDGPSLRSSYPAAASSGERILLVEDDFHVRGVAARALRLQGYDVTEVADGEGALELARTAASFDLIVSDVVMPRLGGPALAARLRAEGLLRRIVFISGYAEQLPSIAGAHVLAKPFNSGALLRVVRTALTEAPVE